MTSRAFILGLMVAAMICGITYFNDAVLMQNYLIGNYMPIVVFGPALLVIVFLNPAVRRLRAGFSLQPAELALIISMAMCACAIPGTNLMRKFTTLLMLPHHLNRTAVGWKEAEVLDRVPEQMLADPSSDPSVQLDGFVQGLSTGTEQIAFGEIPWEAWTGTFAFWIPLILVLWVGMLGLGLVLHRQWSDHEKLPYPVVGFLNMFIEADTSGKSLLRNRGFLIAGGIVLVIHLSNYLYAWNSSWIEFPLSFDFGRLLDEYPIIEESTGQAGHLVEPHIYFSVVAIAFFLSREVSLSMGLGPYLFGLVMTVFMLSGVNVQTAGIKSNLFPPGACFGLISIIIFTGWYHYLSVLKAALRMPIKVNVLSHERWGMRIFLISQVAFILILARMELDWRIALFFSIALVATFVVLSRALAETGLFYMQTQWAPTLLILNLLGFKTVGPNQVAILLLLGLVLQASPRAAILPFFVNGLKFFDLRKVPMGKGTSSAMAAVIIGLLVAIPVTLYIQYDRGVNYTDLWAVEGVPRAPFKFSMDVETALEAKGELAATQDLAGWDRFKNWEPNRTSVITFLLGFGVFLAVAGLRLRFAGWPLHPIVFIFWQTPHLAMFAFSFLLGWGLKFAVTRYGGQAGYGAIKPVIMGLFVGEMLGAMIPILIGWMFHFFGSEVAPPYAVLPYW